MRAGVAKWLEPSRAPDVEWATMTVRKDDAYSDELDVMDGSLDASRIDLDATTYFDQTPVVPQRAGADWRDWSLDSDEESQGDYELEERHALRRVSGLSTELDDVSEVE